MRFIRRSVLGLFFVSSLLATGANALVSVDYADDSGGAALGIGSVFHVDVSASWDGTPAGLEGLFTSTRWDPTQIQLTGATNAPFQIFVGPDGALGRLSNPRSFAGDAPGTLRTVQHGVLPSQSAAPGGPTLITRLTFTVLGVGDGVAEIEGFINQGDTIFTSSSLNVPPSSYTLGSTSVTIVPEPGSALLVGFGLSILAERRRRMERGEAA